MNAVTTGGTVFRIAPDGTGFTVLHTFTGSATEGGRCLAGLLQGIDGSLYGTSEMWFERRTMVIEFVESDGNGRTKGYLPEDPAAARVTPMPMDPRFEMRANTR